MATAEAWQIINKVYANDKDQISVEVTDQHTLDKDAVSKLFRGLYSSTRVRSLSMQNVGLNDTHFQELVFIIGYNGFLKELSIVDEGLNLEAIETILWAINKKASISKLKLENPKTEILTTKLQEKIAKFFADKKVLRRMRRCNTTAKGVHAEG